MSQRKPDFYNFIINEPVFLSYIYLYELTPGLLYAFLTYKFTFLGIFKSPSDAAQQLDGKKDNKYIRRYINLERPVIVGPLRIPVFFAMHPDWKKDTIGRAGYKWKPQKSSLNKKIVLVDKN
jgi:hypothetical protein